MLFKSLISLLFASICLLSSAKSFADTTCSPVLAAHHEEIMPLDQQHSQSEDDFLKKELRETCDNLFSEDMLPIMAHEFIFVPIKNLYSQVFFSGFHTEFPVELPPPRA